MLRAHWLLIISSAISSSSAENPFPNGHSLTLPLHQHKLSRSLQKRKTVTSIGLGDSSDIIYSVEVQIGSDSYPLAFDTGSSDILVLTDQCTTQNCDLTQDVPLVPHTSLNFTGLSAHFEFGGTSDSTSVDGEIASASVGLAGTSVTQQFLGTIQDTDLPLGQQGLSGLFGAGFPAFVGSPIEVALLENSLSSGATPAAFSNAFFSTIQSNSPLFTRLILNNQLEQPMFTVTLERETFEIGGNVGQLTLGGLPEGVSNDTLAWVPVRLYTTEQGGIPSPSSNPNEIYPLRWEIPLDDVLINGAKLPQVAASRAVGYTALIDSGTTGILGPQAIVNAIFQTIATSRDEDGSVGIPCNVPVELTFVIGGKNFPLDPRDFFLQQPSVESCSARVLQPLDAPSPGALMSWVLGASFMRSNLVAFYFGNLTHPSRDPPKIGFLSTVPSNASQTFVSDIDQASMLGGGLPESSIAAPPGTFDVTATNTVGVGQQPTPTNQLPKKPEGSTGKGGSGSAANGSKPVSVPLLETAIIITFIQIILS